MSHKALGYIVRAQFYLISLVGTFGLYLSSVY